jgi:hypothetical protein
MMIGAVGQALVVQRSGGTDRFGGSESIEEHTSSGWVLAPDGGEEVVAGGDRVSSQLTAYGPVDSDVIATDRVVLPDGTRWDITGDPERFRTPLHGHPFSSAQGVCVIHLKRVTG